MTSGLLPDWLLILCNVIAGLALLALRLKKERVLVQSFFIYGILLISPVSWINHYLLLIFPYYVLINHIKFKWEQPLKRLGLIGFCFALGLMVFNIGNYNQALSFLFLGNFILFLIVLAGLLRQERRVPA